MRRVFPSPESLQAAAEALTSVLGAEGLVISLVGDLGVGKTVFAKGLGRGLGLDPDGIASPTFAIAAEYTLADGRRFAHVDLYRLSHPAELEAAGFLDLLRPGDVIAVEWGNRFPGALPADHLELRLSRADDLDGPDGPALGPALGPEEDGVGEKRRTLNAVAFGAESARVLGDWESALG